MPKSSRPPGEIVLAPAAEIMPRAWLRATGRARPGQLARTRCGARPVGRARNGHVARCLAAPVQHPVGQPGGFRRVLMVPRLDPLFNRSRAGPTDQFVCQLPPWGQPDVEHICDPAGLRDVTDNGDLRRSVLLQRLDHSGPCARRDIRVHGVPALGFPVAVARGGPHLRLFPLHGLAIGRPSRPDAHDERPAHACPARPPARGAGKDTLA